MKPSPGAPVVSVWLTPAFSLCALKSSAEWMLKRQAPAKGRMRGGREEEGEQENNRVRRSVRNGREWREEK